MPSTSRETGRKALLLHWPLTSDPWHVISSTKSVSLIGPTVWNSFLLDLSSTKSTPALAPDWNSFLRDLSSTKSTTALHSARLLKHVLLKVISYPTKLQVLPLIYSCIIVRCMHCHYWESAVHHSVLSASLWLLTVVIIELLSGKGCLTNCLHYLWFWFCTPKGKQQKQPYLPWFLFSSRIWKRTRT